MGPMLRLAPRDDLAGGDVEGGKEIERTVAQIGVGAAVRHVKIHRQDPVRALERLDLRFSSTASTTALVGGFMYNPTTSRTLATSWGSGDILNERVRCGLSPKVRQMRPNSV